MVPMTDADSTDPTTTITPTQKLREKLAAFRFNSELSPELRRSPRNHARLLKLEEEDLSLPTLASDDVAPPGTSSRKRARTQGGPSRDSTAKKRRAGPTSTRMRKGAHGVAPFEKYAHLKGLSDHLGDSTDVLDG